jgi:nucleoside-diphosphate-sugar epimerase
VSTERAVTAWDATRVVVFGATGFIGSWVARRVGAAGAQVTLAARDREAAAALATELGARAHTVQVDVCDDARVAAVLREVRPHVTFNLAGYGVDHAERDAGTANRVNERFVGVLCAAVAAHRDRDWRGQALVHTGSQLEYGPIGGAMHEDAEPAPTTVYGRTKLAGTQALSACAAARGLPALTARLFMVYGPGEHRGRLLPTLMAAAASGAPVPLTSGTQQTDFVYVEDVADGLVRLARAQVEPGAIVNLASGRLTSIREFVERAATLLDIPAERLRFGALPQRPETLQYEPVSNARLRALTGWVPSTNVTEGIRRTLNLQERKHESDSGA